MNSLIMKVMELNTKTAKITFKKPQKIAVRYEKNCYCAYCFLKRKVGCYIAEWDVPFDFLWCDGKTVFDALDGISTYILALWEYYNTQNNTKDTHHIKQWLLENITTIEEHINNNTFLNDSKRWSRVSLLIKARKLMIKR